MTIAEAVAEFNATDLMLVRGRYWVNCGRRWSGPIRRSDLLAALRTRRPELMRKTIRETLEASKVEVVEKIGSKNGSKNPPPDIVEQQRKARAEQPTITLVKVSPDDQGAISLPLSGTWAEFKERLKHRAVESKEAATLVCPIIPINERGRREKLNVQAVTAGVLDLDGIDELSLRRTLKALTDDGIAFVLHSTYRHSAERWKLRIWIPFKKPVPASQWARVWRAIAAKYAPNADPQCKDESRAYYLPSCPPDRLDAAVREVVDGAPLDWTTLKLPAEPELTFSDSNEHETSVREISEAERAALVSATIECYPAEGRRHAYRLAFAGAARNKGFAPEIAAAVLLEATEAVGGSGRDAEQSVRDTYSGERAATGVPALLDLGGQAVADALDAVRDAHSLARALDGVTFTPGEVREPDPPSDALVHARIEHYTDLGNARRLLIHFGSDLRHCLPRRKWLTWEGCRWRWDDSGAIKRYAKRTIDQLYHEIGIADDRAACSKWARQSEGKQRIEAMIDLAASDVAVLPGDLDADPWLLNVLNGTLDLRSGELRPHDRADLCTKVAAVEYAPDARSELWDSFVSTLTGGDPELAAYIQRALGCALIGEHREKAFWVAHGPPDGGKSTFIGAIAGVLGDYHVSADAETWLTRSHVGANRGDLVRLMGARLVTTSEFKRGVRFDPKTIKQITGGDRITAAAKYEAEIEFSPSFCLWFAANDAPAIDSDEAGMWSRARRIPCEHSIPKARQDRTLPRKLAEPDVKSAILAWLVAGLAAYLRDGLGSCPAVERSTEAYRRENDRFAEWLEECCELSAQHFTPAKVLRDAYTDWARRNGARALSGKMLGHALREAGCEPGKHGIGSTRGWRGIAITA